MRIDYSYYLEHSDKASFLKMFKAIPDGAVFSAWYPDHVRLGISGEKKNDKVRVLINGQAFSATTTASEFWKLLVNSDDDKTQKIINKANHAYDCHGSGHFEKDPIHNWLVPK